MRLSSSLRVTAAALAFSAPFLVMSCQEVPLFPLPEDGGTETTSGTGGAASTTATTATTATGATTTGAGSTSATGTGGAGGVSPTTAGTGGAGGTGGTSTVAGAGGAGGVALDAGADAMGTGGAGGMAEDAGMLDAGPDDAMAADASDDAMALDDGGADAMALDDGSSDAGGGACVSNTFAFPVEPGAHVQVCSPLVYATNPPTSGPHYPVWAAFKSYKAPVPRGFTLHSMEHGAVVFSYNCPDGCAAEIDALEAMLASRPADPLCVAPLTGRYIVTPDPLLDSRFAAAAWGFALKAECMDVAAMSAFTDAHYALAPENFCFDGTDVLAPAYNLLPGCGTPPISDAGTD